MDGSWPGRKRQRENEEDDECMPISKRINRLHIRPSRSGGDEGEASTDNSNAHGTWSEQSQNLSVINENGVFIPQHQAQCDAEAGMSTAQGNPRNEQLQYAQDDLTQYQHLNVDHRDLLGNVRTVRADDQDSGFSSTSDGDVYDPELDRAHNPHYFQANQMLHQAHIARSQRHNHQQ